MDQRDNHGKDKQVSEESSAKNNKGKMVAATNYYDHFSGVEPSYFTSNFPISPYVCGSSSMTTTFMMESPISDEFMHQLICEMLDAKHNNTPDNNHHTVVENDNNTTTSLGELMGASDTGVVVLQSQTVTESDFNEAQEWVTRVKQSWAETGCTIILDVWYVGPEKRTTLMNVVVDSPLGSVYLKSLDVSFAVDNVESMDRVIDALIQEVGPQNVLQIMTCTTAPWLEAVAERIKERYEWMFWSVSTTYCLALMLERVESSIGWVQQTIAKAKRVTRLFHSTPFVTILDQLLKKKTKNDNNDYYKIVKHSMIRAATPFLTLENMLIRKKQLRTIFTSKKFKTSSIGLSPRGRGVANLLVNDKLFWSRLTLAVKGGMPIFNVLKLIRKGNYDKDGSQMGIIYETIDQMIETIMDEMGKTTAGNDFWDIIDEIWNGTLHSPLHAAGFYLNPKLFFTKDLEVDFEVLTGLMATVVKLGGDQDTQTLISHQLKSYQCQDGQFNSGVKQVNHLSPVKWWKRYGNECPELQKFAIKVLGISCDGGPCNELRKDVAEKMFSVSDEDDTDIAATTYKMLNDQCFVSYNLHLKKLSQSRKTAMAAAEVGATCLYNADDDWIVGE